MALTIRGMAPTYISDCITICNEVAVRDTRNSTSANLLSLPYASLDILKNSFAYEAHLYGTRWLPGFARVPHYAPSPCHMYTPMP